MRFKYDDKYLIWGVTVLLVICTSLLFFFALYRIDMVSGTVRMIFSILSPFIYGLALAYLLTPIYNFFEEKCLRFLQNYMESKRTAWKLARGFSTLITISIAIFVVAGVIGMMLPQLLASIVSVAESLPGNIERLAAWINEQLQARPELQQPATVMVNRVLSEMDNWVQLNLIPNISSILARVSTSIMVVFSAILDLFVGIIICIYSLNSKRTFAAQMKKVVYSILPRSRANTLIEDFRFTHRVFGGFIYGKLLDSLIIGIICFCCMSLMRMPYVMLISVIIGITNIIPFFGPFIGAIPSALLVLTVSPIQCLYFLVFVLILQQVDGNIIGPKILGDSTGLSSFWVIFAILMGGGLFGFPGMVLGVPVFAIIYTFVNRHIDRSLKKKGMSVDIAEYTSLDHVDLESGHFVERSIPVGSSGRRRR